MSKKKDKKNQKKYSKKKYNLADLADPNIAQELKGAGVKDVIKLFGLKDMSSDELKHIKDSAENAIEQSGENIDELIEDKKILKKIAKL